MRTVGSASIKVLLLLTGFSISVTHRELLYNEKPNTAGSDKISCYFGTLVTHTRTHGFFLGEKCLYFCSLILLIYTATLKILCQDCHILNTDEVARGTFLYIYIYIHTYRKIQD